MSEAGKCIPLNRPNYSPVVNQQKSDLLVDCLDIGMEWQNICEMATISGYVHLTRTQTLCIVLVRDDWNVQEWPSRRSQPIGTQGKISRVLRARPRSFVSSLSSPKKIGKLALGMSQHR